MHLKYRTNRIMADAQEGPSLQTKFVVFHRQLQAFDFGKPAPSTGIYNTNVKSSAKKSQVTDL